MAVPCASPFGMSPAGLLEKRSSSSFWDMDISWDAVYAIAQSPRRADVLRRIQTLIGTERGPGEYRHYDRRRKFCQWRIRGQRLRLELGWNAPMKPERCL